MIVVFGYPLNKARANIRPSQFGVSISTPGKGECYSGDWRSGSPAMPRRGRAHSLFLLWANQDARRVRTQAAPILSA
jgi:hypothetical protein